MSNRFNNLDIGGGFSLLQNAPCYKMPFVFNNYILQGHTLSFSRIIYSKEYFYYKI